MDAYIVNKVDLTDMNVHSQKNEENYCGVLNPLTYCVKKTINCCDENCCDENSDCSDDVGMIVVNHVEKTTCPPNYLENLYEFIQTNHINVDHSDRKNYNEFLISSNKGIVLENKEAVIPFVYLVNNDINKLEKILLEYIKIGEKNLNDNHLNKNEIENVISTVKIIEMSEKMEDTTFSETQKAVFMIICIPEGTFPLFVDDVGIHFKFINSINNNTFDTQDYI